MSSIMDMCMSPLVALLSRRNPPPQLQEVLQLREVVTEAAAAETMVVDFIQAHIAGIVDIAVGKTKAADGVVHNAVRVLSVANCRIANTVLGDAAVFPSLLTTLCRETKSVPIAQLHASQIVASVLAEGDIKSVEAALRRHCEEVFTLLANSGAKGARAVVEVMFAISVPFSEFLAQGLSTAIAISPSPEPLMETLLAIATSYPPETLRGEKIRPVLHATFELDVLGAVLAENGFCRAVSQYYNHMCRHAAEWGLSESTHLPNVATSGTAILPRLYKVLTGRRAGPFGEDRLAALEMVHTLSVLGCWDAINRSGVPSILSSVVFEWPTHSLMLCVLVDLVRSVICNPAAVGDVQGDFITNSCLAECILVLDGEQRTAFRGVATELTAIMMENDGVKAIVSETCPQFTEYFQAAARRLDTWRSPIAGGIKSRQGAATHKVGIDESEPVDGAPPSVATTPPPSAARGDRPAAAAAAKESNATALFDDLFSPTPTTPSDTSATPPTPPSFMTTPPPASSGAVKGLFPVMDEAAPSSSSHATPSSASASTTSAASLFDDVMGGTESTAAAAASTPPPTGAGSGAPVDFASLFGSGASPPQPARTATPSSQAGAPPQPSPKSASSSTSLFDSFSFAEAHSAPQLSAASNNGISSPTSLFSTSAPTQQQAESPVAGGSPNLFGANTNQQTQSSGGSSPNLFGAGGGAAKVDLFGGASAQESSFPGPSQTRVAPSVPMPSLFPPSAASGSAAEPRAWQPQQLPPMPQQTPPVRPPPPPAPSDDPFASLMADATTKGLKLPSEAERSAKPAPPGPQPTLFDMMGTGAPRAPQQAAAAEPTPAVAPKAQTFSVDDLWS